MHGPSEDLVHHCALGLSGHPGRILWGPMPPVMHQPDFRKTRNMGAEYFAPPSQGPQKAISASPPHTTAAPPPHIARSRLHPKFSKRLSAVLRYPPCLTLRRNSGTEDGVLRAAIASRGPRIRRPADRRPDPCCIPCNIDQKRTISAVCPN